MLLVILGDILFLIAGILIGKYFFSNRAKTEKDLAQAKAELGDLRNRMKQHLSETSFLFQQFDGQYRKLLKHFGDMSKDISTSISTDNLNDPKVLTSVKSINDLQSRKESHGDAPIQPKDYEV